MPRLRALALLIVVLGCEPPPPPAPLDAGPPATPSVARSADPIRSLPPPRPRKRAEDCPAGPAAVFPSLEVEAAVRKKLKQPTGPVTLADLGRLKSLDLSQITVDDLDICLFPRMVALEELFLGKGELDDLSPIAGATRLMSLRASMNRVRDLKPLAGMTRMDRLDLGLTQVADLTPLSAMTDLTELQLDDTPVDDVTPLGKLQKLQRLSLQRTRVKSFAPLSGCKGLKFLYVAGSPGEFDAQSQLGKLAQDGLRIILGS